MHEPSAERITQFLQQELGASSQRRDVSEIASDLVTMIRGELDIYFNRHNQLVGEPILSRGSCSILILYRDS